MACVAKNETNGVVYKVKKGTTLITAEPFVFILNSLLRKERCDFCFSSGKLSRCSECQYVYYCGKECQRKSWAIHKVECPCIKKVRPKVLPDAGRLMARIIIKLSQGGKEERGYYTPTKYRTFYDLMTHASDIKKDIKKMEHFTSLSVVLMQFLPSNLLPACGELIGIFGRMSVNSFNILDTDMTSLGTGTYLGPSILNHSCRPNANAIFDGTTIIIRALCDIPVLDWSKIFITYIDLLKDTKMRRAELQQAYYFWCDCERCETPETIEVAAACPNKQCTNPCPPTDSTCSKCGAQFPEGFQKKFDEVVELSKHQLEKMVSVAYLDVSRMCLERQEGVFHPYNLLVVRMLEMAVAASVDLELWDVAEQFISQIIPKYLYYYGETHPMTGQMYFSWGKLLSLQKKGDKALEVVEKAANIIRLSYGERHSKVRNEVKPLVDQLLAEYFIKKNGY